MSQTAALANTGASVGIFIIVVLVLLCLGAFAVWGNKRSRANLDEDLAEHPEEDLAPDNAPDASEEDPNEL